MTSRNYYLQKECLICTLEFNMENALPKINPVYNLLSSDRSSLKEGVNICICLHNKCILTVKVGGHSLLSSYCRGKSEKVAMLPHFILEHLFENAVTFE